MRMHTIEIDDDVLSYLKSRAEPFVDNPNTVLRRELLSEPKRGRPIAVLRPVTHQVASTFPGGTPKALAEILDVVTRVRSGSARQDATHHVADKYRVTFQTVLDKYTRQLGLTAFEFDKLLEPSRLSELRELLVKKFPDHADLIDQELR